MRYSAVHGLSLLSLGLFLGCNNTPKNTNPDSRPIARNSSAPLKPLAIPERPNGTTRPADFDDKEALIPAPPSMPSNRDLTAPRVNEAVLVARGVEGETVNPAVTDEGLLAVKRLHQQATERYRSIAAFECRLTRREMVNNKAQPQEVIAFRFRKQPYAVYLRWIGDEAKGREVVYADGRNDNKMQILPAKSDMPLGLRPMRQSYLPSDPVVRSSCRHDIREAGVSEQILQIGRLIARIDRTPGQRSLMKYLGPVRRPEFPYPLEGIEETVLPRSETLLPQGGKRVIYFDPSTTGASAGLPVLVVTHDAAAKEVEYYCFDRFLLPIRLDDADFDADRLWKK